MNENELKRNENLCNKLDMNFEEANELFGKDTLSNMQMVRVNGGSVVVAVALITVVGSALYLLYQHITSGDEPQPGESSGDSSGGSNDTEDVEITQTENGVDAKRLKFGFTISGDSAHFFDAKTGAHTMTIYGIKITPSP